MIFDINIRVVGVSSFEIVWNVDMLALVVSIDDRGAVCIEFLRTTVDIRATMAIEANISETRCIDILPNSYWTSSD